MADIDPRSLNDFPEHLLLYILTFLPTLDAVRSSLLSRKWRNLWSSIPSLNFDYSLFPPSADSPSDTRRRFADFVDNTLILRSPSPLLKLRFQFDFAEYFYWSHIDSWIHYAINHNAVELDIDFYIDRGYHNHDNECDYDFNFCSLKNSRVRDLKLCRCELILPYNMTSLRFDSIRSVYLDQIYLADETVVDLILGCVNLESLVLDYCYGMKSLRINSSKLKELSLWCFHTQNEEEESLEICCPNLHWISIINFQMGKYCIKDSASLVEAQVEFLHELRNYGYWSKVVRLFSGVKLLTVQNWWFKCPISLKCLYLKLLGQKDASSDRFALNNLSHLQLLTEYTKYDLLGIAALLEICPNISTLTLDYLFKVDGDESLSEELLNRPINFSIPNLKHVKLKNFRGTDNELQFLRLLKKHGAVIEKIVIRQKVGEISLPLQGSSQY